uniref:Presenilin-like protein n=1 Tax=Romanomermis culicivorax TaxID=13658 RepID=A0A915HXF3_ROMCU
MAILWQPLTDIYLCYLILNVSPSGAKLGHLVPHCIFCPCLLRDVLQDSMYLGLGDFIFYSLLMGKVTEFSIRDMNSEVLVDWNMIIACYFAILLGLLLTVIVLLVFERALPALPFSLTIGIMFYFLTSTVISPFLQLMQPI